MAVIDPAREDEGRRPAPLTEHGLDATRWTGPEPVASAPGSTPDVLERWRAGVR